MKLCKPSFEIWEQPAGLEGIYKQIERTGRVCYKSEDKITENSAKPFVDRMIKSQHYAMLEHGTVYLKVPYGKMLDDGSFENEKLATIFIDNPYSIVRTGHPLSEDCWYITSNYRVIIENDLLYILQYLCESVAFHEKRITVHFIADIGVMREFFRHRLFSMAQESTRYCNYSKNKFNNELTFIAPDWMDKTSFDNVQNYLQGKEYDISFGSIHLMNALSQCESCYLNMIKDGMNPQQARAVLPLAIKAEGVMTGFVSDWHHFFDLRALGTTGAPHPQAKELAEPLMEEFIKRKYINN